MARALDIDLVIQRCEALAARAASELGADSDLADLLGDVTAAAGRARRVTRRIRRPWSLHRLPVVFLVVVLTALIGGVYWNFFLQDHLIIAMSDRDAKDVRERLKHAPYKDQYSLEPTSGSQTSIDAVTEGRADLAFVQGGVEVPDPFSRLELPKDEVLLFFVRDGLQGPQDVHRVLTSVQDAGSHTLAKVFFGAWGKTVEYVHCWPALTTDSPGPDDAGCPRGPDGRYTLPADVDAIFVVKDFKDDKTFRGVERAAAAGLHLARPDIGARELDKDYLSPFTIRPGYLSQSPLIPAEPIETYQVETWLVARPNLRPALLAQAARLVYDGPTVVDRRSLGVAASDASDLFQGAQAFFALLVDIGLAFVALAGLDVVAYRREFHRLNSLVSQLSLLQSDRDVRGVGPEREVNLTFLQQCSDAAGLISALSGFYRQENAALLFDNSSEVVHQRCDALKINIQLKILHALLPSAHSPRT